MSRIERKFTEEKAAFSRGMSEQLDPLWHKNEAPPNPYHAQITKCIRDLDLNMPCTSVNIRGWNAFTTSTQSM